MTSVPVSEIVAYSVAAVVVSAVLAIAFYLIVERKLLIKRRKQVVPTALKVIETTKESEIRTEQDILARNDNAKPVERELPSIKKVGRQRNIKPIAKVYQQPQTTDCESGTEPSL